MAGIPQVITEDRASGAQFIEGSLKFDSGKGQYLKRRPTSNGNRNLWTWSGWLKRTPGTLQDIFSAGQEVTNDGLYSRFRIDSDDYLNYRQWVTTSSLDAYLVSSMKLRDPSAYFHYVAIYDSNNSTNSDKVRFYINGQRVTVFSSNDYPGGTNRGWVNAGGKTHTIGGHYDGGSSADSFWNGHMSQVYFLDGIAAGPEEFGYTDPLTGTWRPKKYVQSGANNGTTWSLGTTAGNIESVRPWALGFDGREDTFTRPNSNQMASIMFDTPINFTNKFEIRGARDSGNTGSIEVYDGTDAWIDVSSSFGSYSQAYDYPRVDITSSITSPVKGIRFNGVSAVYQPRFTQIYVDDKILIDGDTSNMGLHGFYLPLDGNSPVGKDQSGNGNDWEPVNFGGSVELPKATGAIPILNTNEAGTIAKNAVRNDAKTYTVTASGGNYYLDGALKPTLNAYRGGSYTFDYTGATSHPLYLSSLPDGKHNSKAYSVEFDGTNDHLNLSDSTDLEMGGSDFTIEAYIKPTGTPGTSGYNCIFAKGPSLQCYFMTNGGVTLFASTNYSVSGYNILNGSGPAADSVSLNKWHHIAVCRSGDTWKVFVDGIEKYSGTHSGSIENNVDNFSIGDYGSSAGTYEFQGFISNFRIVKGTALYTSSFTPPSTTLTNVTGTTLLCCQDSNAATGAVLPSGSTISATGNATASNTSPFLFDTNGYYGVNTETSNTTKITIPHWAPDTLYYYCNAHSGMGSSINVTTDIFKADPYAWKNFLALPLLGNDDDISDSVNCTSNAKTPSNSSVIPSSVQSNFYGGSHHWSANSDTLQYAQQGDELVFGTGDFTIELWFYDDGGHNGGGGGRCYLFDNRIGGSVVGDPPQLTGFVDNSNEINLGAASTIEIQNVDTNNRWIHYAAVRSSGTVTLYIDGVAKARISDTTNYPNNGIGVGRATDGGYGWAGYIQDFRVYTGVAKYTENFVVPATEPDVLPDTPSGITGKTNLAKITDGAVAFDGSGDYLGIGDSSDFSFDGDFTVEAFVYQTVQADHKNIFSTEDFDFKIRGNGKVRLYTASSGTDTTQSVRLNTWTHLALVRESGTIKVYFNGVGETVSQTIASDGSSAAEVGRRIRGSQEPFDGFISNLRVVKGTALYTSDFTPPTEPLTEVTNTKLLCCQSQTSVTAAAVQPTAITNTRIPSGFSWWDAGATAGWSVAGSNTSGSNSDYVSAALPTSGKIYWETVVKNPSTYSVIGVTDDGGNAPGNNGYQDNVSGYYFNGNPPIYLAKRSGASSTSSQVTHGSSTGTTWVSGDILMWAVDCGSSRMWIGRNGTWYASGNPAGGTNYAFHNMNVHTGGTYFKLAYHSSSSTDAKYEIKTEANSTLLADKGNAAATNFNPFITDDINAIRGQETGYATLNPLDVSPSVIATRGTTLSDGNLTSTVSSPNNREVVGNIVASSGKYYYEAMFDPGYSNNNSDGAGWVADDGLGVDNSTAGGFMMIVRDNGGTIVGNGNGSRTNQGAGTHPYNYSPGDVMGCAIDLDSRIATWYKNGHKHSFVVDFSSRTNLNGLEFKPLLLNRSAGSIFVNFGQKPFKFPPPDGFQPLNLSNVQPEKVIARPDQYLNTVLYNGTGVQSGTNSINVGIKPDLVWIKERTGAFHHALYDSVRGVQKSISTSRIDLTEHTESAGLNRFTSTGFDLAPGDGYYYVNRNNQPYVAWCWKAGGDKNTFNIDDVGYANASDVSMNAGGLNSSFYDQSQVWTNSFAGRSLTNASNAFDGSTSTICQSPNHADAYLTLTYTFTNVTSLRVYASNPTNNQMRLNNTGSYTLESNLGASANSSWRDLTSLIPANGTVTHIEARNSGTNTNGVNWAAIEVNGKLLINAINDSVTWSNNLTGLSGSSLTNPTRAFNANPNNYADSTAGWTLDLSGHTFGTGTHTIELLSGGASSFTVNGSTSLSTSGSSGAIVWTGTHTGELTSLTSSATGASVYYIKIDGKYLADPGQNSVDNIPSIALTGCSVGTKQGFSIIKWQGDGSNANRTVPHGLLEAPSFVIVKPLTESNRHWLIWHKDLNDDAAMLFDGGSPAGARFGPNAPTSNVFGVYGGQGNRGTTDFIGYCWHDVPGLQKFGSYTGNGSSDGPFIELGFRPAVIIIKRTEGGTGNWTLWDATRNPTNVMGKQIYPNLSNAEADAGTNSSFGILDFVSNGVKIRGSHSSFNSSGHTFVYAVWAEAPSINLYGAQANAR